jgi:hypothetical protein
VSENIKRIKSQNQVMAEKRLEDIHTFAAAMEVLRRPGGVLKLFDEARASEKDRRKLVRALERIRERAAQAVTDVGDDRRARGQSVPLCWLPPGPALTAIEEEQQPAQRTLNPSA